MQRFRFVTIAIVALATLSFSTAAHSVIAPPQKNKKSTELAKRGLITPPQKTLNRKSDELAKRGVFAPPQKTLNKKSDELAKRGLMTPPQKTLNKKSDELAKRGLMTPPQKGSGASQKGIIIVSGKDNGLAQKAANNAAKSRLGSDRMLNPQPLPPKALTTGRSY